VLRRFWRWWSTPAGIAGLFVIALLFGLLAIHRGKGAAALIVPVAIALIALQAWIHRRGR